MSTEETDQEEPELGVLLTGGKDSTSSLLSSAEFFGSEGEGCNVPDLPEPRRGHVTFVTSDGTIASCGGWTEGDGQEASTTSEATTTPLGGVVTSPNYPENYPDNFDKTFTIEGSLGKIIQITFVDFNIHYYGSCRDWLQVTVRTVNKMAIWHQRNDPNKTKKTFHDC